jgi:hypothetical protein
MLVELIRDNEELIGRIIIVTVVALFQMRSTSFPMVAVCA